MLIGNKQVEWQIKEEQDVIMARALHYDAITPSEYSLLTYLTLWLWG